MAHSLEGRRDSDVDWVKSQKKAFTGWMNASLARRQIFVKDLAKDLADGTVLINLAEILTGQSVGAYAKQPKFRVHKLENVDKAIQLLKKNGIELHGLANEDVVDGKMKIILGSVWRLIRSFQLAKHAGRTRSGSYGMASTKEDLLTWVRNEVSSYDVPIKNFTSSFSDGKAFMALVHKRKPDCVDWENFNFANKFDTVETALNLAEEHFQLPELIEANEVALGLTDEQSMMTYLSIFRDAVGGDSDEPGEGPAGKGAAGSKGADGKAGDGDDGLELKQKLALAMARIAALEEDAADNEEALRQAEQQQDAMRDKQLALEAINAELQAQVDKLEGRELVDASTQTDRPQAAAEMSTQASELQDELEVTYRRISQLEEEKSALEKEANDAILAQVEEDGKRHALQVKLADAQMKLLELKNKNRPGGLFPPNRHRSMSTMSTASEIESYTELNSFINDVEDDVVDLKQRMAKAVHGDSVEVGPKLAAFMALSGRASPGSPLRLSTVSTDGDLPDGHPEKAKATSTEVEASPATPAQQSGSASITLTIPETIGSEMRDSHEVARAAALADSSPDQSPQQGHAPAPAADNEGDEGPEISIEEEASPADDKRKYRATKRANAMEDLAASKEAKKTGDDDMRRDRVQSDVSMFDTAGSSKRGANPTASAFRQRKRELDMLKETKMMLDRERARRKVADDENRRLRQKLRQAQKEAQLARMTPEEKDTQRAKIETDVDKFMDEFLRQPAVLDLLDSLPFRVESLGCGVYKFGTKKIHVFIIRNHAMVRIGGGYIKFEEFVEKHAIVESEKVRAMALKKGVGKLVPEEDKEIMLEEQTKFSGAKWKEY